MDSPAADNANSGREEEIPRFQLSFASDKIASRTEIRKATLRLLGISIPIVTSKFYVKNLELTNDEEKEVQMISKKLEMIDNLGPREKYEEPILESHSYGWFQEKLIERIPDIDRNHFPKRTSEMVKIQNLLNHLTKK